MPRTKKSAEKNNEESAKKSTEKAKVSEEEFEKEVIELAEQGLTSEKIGETLRRKGIHPKDYSKNISKILKEKNLYVVPDVKNIEKKYEAVAKHAEKNKQDKRAKRDKDRIFAKLRRAKKYYK